MLSARRFRPDRGTPGRRSPHGCFADMSPSRRPTVFKVLVAVEASIGSVVNRVLDDLNETPADHAGDERGQHGDGQALVAVDAPSLSTRTLGSLNVASDEAVHGERLIEAEGLQRRAYREPLLRASATRSVGVQHMTSRASHPLRANPRPLSGRGDTLRSGVRLKRRCSRTPADDQRRSWWWLRRWRRGRPAFRPMRRSRSRCR